MNKIYKINIKKINKISRNEIIIVKTDTKKNFVEKDF